jgi:hypothetical protein
MPKIDHEGVLYTVAEGETLEDLFRKTKNGKTFSEIHEENMLQRSLDMAAPTPEELAYKEREAEKSGFGTALLQGLSNDQGYQTAWLSQQRFPELVERDINPVDFYYLDEDEDIAYIDPYTQQPKKEFKDSILIDSARYVGPTAQFVGELVGGTAGLIAGALTTGNPYGAGVGGSLGTAISGGAIYGGRAGISAAFDGPPLKLSQLQEDLAWSSAFGALPFGTKAAQTTGNIFKTSSKKFAGNDGRTALQSILTDGGKTVDEKIAFSKDRWGIDLTRADASGMINSASEIQRFLQMQPGSQKLWDFYHNRQLQVEEAADEFFNEILTGKYLPASQQARLSGRIGLDPAIDLTKASEAVLLKLTDKRKARAGRVYDNSFELDIPIDVSDLAAKLEAELGDANLRGQARKVKQAMLDSITDFTGFSPNRVPIRGANRNEMGLKDNTELLHGALSNDLRPLIETLTKDNQITLKREVARFREQISNRLKDANPEYKRAAAIYDPTKGHIQALESSVIRSLADAAELGGTQAARLMKSLFTGNIPPADLRKLRRLIETEDPQVWQNVKGTWLRTQFDDAIVSSKSPLGGPNRFLSKLGIRGGIELGKPRTFLPSGRGTAKARGTKAQVFEEILGPEELDNFIQLTELMQAVSFIATKSGSPTQPFQAMNRLLEKDVTGLGRGAMNLGRAIIDLPARVLVRGFDDVAQRSLAFQKEAYEDQLIEALIDPARAAELAAAINAVKPGVYFATQAVAKGTEDVFSQLGNVDPDKIDKNTNRPIRGASGLEMIDSAREVPVNQQKPDFFSEEGQRLREEAGSEIEKMRSLQSSSPPSVTDIFAPLPSMGGGMSSMGIPGATVLPSEQDRELAERLRQSKSGIGGLAV